MPEANCEQLRGILRRHGETYPLMRPCDGVKLIYQNEFGGGHLITDSARTLERLRAEYDAVRHDPSQAIFEDIGNGIVRVMLSALDTGRYPLEALNRDFVRSAGLHRGDMAAFLGKLEVLRELCAQGAFGFSLEELDGYLAEYTAAGCPMVSHSEEYRRAYQPAYRVILRSCCSGML